MVYISIIYPFFATQSNLQNLLHSLKQKQHLKKAQKETSIPTIHFQVLLLLISGRSNHNPNNQMFFIQKNDTTHSPLSAQTYMDVALLHQLLHGDHVDDSATPGEVSWYGESRKFG